MLPQNIYYKIFDKTFADSNGIYGRNRFQDIETQTLVNQNNLAILEATQVEHLMMPHHVHGNVIVDCDELSDYTLEPEADGAITSKTEIAICIQTADCVPILLASSDGQLIGGAHCGWQSTLAGVLENLVGMMQKKGAQQLLSIMGPAIQQATYEVDTTFYERVLDHEIKAQSLFIPAIKPKHYLFDLPGLVRLKLKQLGIGQGIDLCENTYTNPVKYHSYRRDTHLGIASTNANMLSTIWIRA